MFTGSPNQAAQLTSVTPVGAQWEQVLIFFVSKAKGLKNSFQVETVGFCFVFTFIHTFETRAPKSQGKARHAVVGELTAPLWNIGR